MYHKLDVKKFTFIDKCFMLLRNLKKIFSNAFYCNQFCRIKFWLHQNLRYMFIVNYQCILLKHTQIAYYLDVKRTVILYMKYILVTFWCQKACEMLIDYTKFNLKYYHIFTESLLLILKTFINKYPKYDISLLEFYEHKIYL